MLEKSGPEFAALVKELRGALSGAVLTSRDVGYREGTRLWNGAVDRRPAVLARCADERDVIDAVRIAGAHGLGLSVRGGGHDWAGRALRSGGLVLDLSDLRGVTVDAAAGTVRAQGGATVGDLIAAARPHGLVPVTGNVSSVGMAGLTLAGGYGPLVGRFGLALDNLVSAELVTADGRRLTAGEAEGEDADLLWALRGGGGTLGVVTSARYRVHPLPQLLAGFVFFPVDQAPAILRRHRELAAEAPDELGVMIGFLSLPEVGPVVFAFLAWSGELGAGESYAAKVRGLGTPIAEQIGSCAYQDALGGFEAGAPAGRRYAIRTRWLPEIQETCADLLAQAGREVTTPYSMIAIHHFHGRASNIAPEATAFALRRDHLLVEIVAAWDDEAPAPEETHRAWADGLDLALAPHALLGGYPNLLAPQEIDRIAAAYGDNATRLRSLQKRYDPRGMFASAIGGFAHPDVEAEGS